MKYFHYVLADDEETLTYKGEIETVPTGFIESKATMSGFSVYYKIEGTKMTEIIGEAMHEDAARRRVDEFLAAYIAEPFEPL